MNTNKNEIKTNTELAEAIRLPLFSKRETMAEANKYFGSVLEAIDPSERIHVLTAVHVILNTLADHIEALDLKEM